MLSKAFSFLALLVFVGSCTPPVVMLAHPKTGEVKRCSIAEVGAGAHEHATASRIKSCVHHWKSFGYIETEHVTAEQRARLTPGT